jgi:protein phosphatase
MVRFKLESYTATRIPSGRGIGQDCHLADDSKGLYIVSDGIGGPRGGEIASRIVIETVSASLAGSGLDKNVDVRRLLLKAVRQGAAEVAATGRSDPSVARMAATLTLLLLRAGRYWIAQVGDSRGYLLRDGGLSQLTEDHSLAFEQYKIGAISKEEISSHPNQKMLTRSISAAGPSAIPDIADGEVHDGDTFLLCTDGLTKEVSDREVAAALADAPDIKAGARRLIEAVKERDGKDDTTVILACCASVDSFTSSCA